MKGPGVFEFELITPAIAEKYLSKMPRNRSLRMSRVKLMADVFKDKHFRANHQALAFDENGNLVDGQHRLQAIITSGVSVALWVYRASDDLPVLYIDGGIVRSDADAIFIDGNDLANKNIIAILRRMLVGVNTSSYGKKFSRDQLKAALKFHSEAITWASSYFVGKMKGISHGAVIGVVARAYYTQDKSRLAAFCETLYSGIAHNAETDRAALRCRDWLMTTPLTGGGEDARISVFKKVEAALSAFLEKRPLSKLYEVSEEQFPIPDFESKD